MSCRVSIEISTPVGKGEGTVLSKGWSGNLYFFSLSRTFSILQPLLRHHLAAIGRSESGHPVTVRTLALR